MPPTKLGDDRITLAVFRPDDYSAAYLSWLNDAEVMAYTEARLTRHDRKSAMAYLRATEADPDCRFWRILLDHDRHVGNIRLSAITWQHRRADIAVLIGDKQVWGSGIAPRAIRLVARYAFEELGLAKLTAGVYAPNTGCIRAFEKADFKIEAVRPRHYCFEDTLIDGVFMGLLAPDVAVDR